jgi:hypothetical protein
MVITELVDAYYRVPSGTLGDVVAPTAPPPPVLFTTTTGT